MTAAHRRLAAFYRITGEWWRAVDHDQQAGDHQSAALLLVTHQRTFVNNGETTQLLAALQRFTPEQVDHACWAQLQLLVVIWPCNSKMFTKRYAPIKARWGQPM